ncbi:MAG: RHS repeat domain-containing protein [Kofleriaceae bacterium]
MSGVGQCHRRGRRPGNGFQRTARPRLQGGRQPPAPIGCDPESLATYDERDRKVSDTDALGKVTTYQYDSLDRLVWTRDALGNIREQEYDVYGNLVAVRTQRTTTGDGSGQLLPPRGAAGYDPAGLVTARVDTLGRRTGFRYDKWDRLVSR